MGKLARRFQRFPLLLKFLDAHEMLSVQVHPGYKGTGVALAGKTAKTEAWIVLESGKESRIYAGLKPRTTANILRQSVADGTLADHLVSIAPKPGDGVFIPAGTVHSLGGDVVVFEVQQNSDCDGSSFYSCISVHFFVNRQTQGHLRSQEGKCEYPHYSQ
jgi:mannose-6-phosphate isomerase